MGRVAGTVVETRGDRAWIACRSEPSACAACSTGRGCRWSLRGAQPLEVPAELDGRRLEPGDPVELEADDTQLLAAAGRLYLPPLAGLLLAPALASAVGLATGLAPLVAAAAGLACGALVARAWTRRVPTVVLRRP